MEARAAQRDPLDELLSFGGPAASFRLLTTGALAEETLSDYAEHVLTRPRPEPDEAILLDIFAKARVTTAPYAYDRDASGETVLGLIEADPTAGQAAPPVMTDRDWVLLQNICLSE